MKHRNLTALTQLTFNIERQAEVLAVLVLAERDIELTRRAATKLLDTIKERDNLFNERKGN